MTTITNYSQLKSQLDKLIVKVVNGITNEVMEKLRSNIYKYTYEWDNGTPYNYKYANSPLWDYKNIVNDRRALPTFEFRDAFLSQNIQKIVGNYVNEIFYDYTTMSVDKDHGIHYDDRFDGDIRKDLAELLNTDTVFGGKDRQPYFDITIDWLTKNWDNLVAKYFRKNGIISVQRKR